MTTPTPLIDLTPWPEPEPVLVLESAPFRAGGRVVLRAAGELDMASAPLLLTELIALAGSGARHVDLDLKEVRFCDGSGLAVLLEGRRRMVERGGNLTVHDACWSLRRILDICDLTLSLEARRPPQPEREATGPHLTLLPRDRAGQARP